MSLVLCQTTRLSYKVDGMMEKSSPLYQTVEGEIYLRVEHDNAGSIQTRVRGLFWDGGKPVTLKDANRDYFLSRKDITIGEQLLDFVILEMSVDDYCTIKKNPAAAVAQLLIRHADLETQLQLTQQRAKRAKDTADKTLKEVIRIKRYFSDAWRLLSQKLETIMWAFGRKKWRKRIAKQSADFFVPLDDKKVFDDDDIPF